jgi:hypothetical protein
MSQDETEYKPVSGTCKRCECALGFGAISREGTWYCCGECAGEDRCICGCHAGRNRARLPDLYIPSRRMFAARHPDYLKTPKGFCQQGRAFPFADRVGRNAPSGPARQRLPQAKDRSVPSR